MIKGKKKENIFLKVGLTGSMLLFGLIASHPTVNAEDITSNADVILSKGVRLTAVPNFEFGKILYDGQAKSSTLAGENLGDKELSWFDGSGLPEEGIKVYATIKDTPQPGMAEGSLTFSTTEKLNGTASPKTSTKFNGNAQAWYKDAEGKVSYRGKYKLNFNGERTLVVQTDNTESGYTYKEHKTKGVENFKIADIANKVINLPAGLTPAAMEMTIDWDIESAP